MNLIHWFDTYRKCENLQQVYQDIYNINEALPSLQKALETCTSYFSQSSFTPNSLISSLCDLLSERIISLNQVSTLQKKRAKTLLSDHIFTLTYTSTSSSVGYFVERLHRVCDWL